MVVKKSKGSKRESLRDVYADDAKRKDKGWAPRTNYLDVSKFEDVEWYKIKEGRNKLDIIPYVISSDNHPQGREKGKIDYKLDIYVHRRIGEGEANILCLQETFNEPCPVCKEVKQMIASKEYTWKDKEIKDLRAQRRTIMNVIDITEDDQKVKLFDVSHFEFLKNLIDLAEEDEGGFIPYADLEEGKTISFKGNEREGDFKGSFKPEAFKFVDREESYDEDILKDSYPLDAMLAIPTFEEVDKTLRGSTEDDDEDEKPRKKVNHADDDEDEDDEEEQPKKSKKHVEEDDDEDEDADEEEEDEPVKSKKKSKKQEEDDEDDEEEDDEDEDEEPKKKSSKQKCPSGHKFGDDCDETKDCKKCKIWDDCSEAYGK